MSDNDNPCLLFCPYLPLAGSVPIADWQLVPLDQFDGPWHSDRFEELARTFLAAFADAFGQPIERPSLLVRAHTGADGALPPDTERDALQLAIQFATIDAAPSWHPDPGDEQAGSGWGRVTADNADLFASPLDLAEGRIALTQGTLLRMDRSGYTIGSEQLRVPAPLELVMPCGPIGTPDPCVLAAVYEARASADDEAPDASRIATAARWLVKAHRNSPSISGSDRIVFLKTGFEALTGTSNSKESTVRLRGIFESGVGDGANDEDRHVLWSAAEEHHMRHAGAEGGSLCATGLQVWMQALSDARNQIIHDGTDPDLRFHVDGSHYSGHILWVGERLLREAIRVELGKLGHPDLWWSQEARLMRRAFEHAEAQHEAGRP